MNNGHFNSGYHNGSSYAPRTQNRQPFRQQRVSHPPLATNGPPGQVPRNNYNGAGYTNQPPSAFFSQGFGPQPQARMHGPPNHASPDYGSWQQSQFPPGPNQYLSLCIVPQYYGPHQPGPHQAGPRRRGSRQAETGLPTSSPCSSLSSPRVSPCTTPCDCCFSLSPSPPFAEPDLPPIPRRPKVQGSSQSPELDIHTKVLFDCAEDLKDYFGALTSYIKNNDKGISFGFAIDMQGKDLGTPGGEIYVINIMAQPVVDGCLLLCSDRALPEIQSELFTADLRELCRPHVVDLYVLGQRAFDVHAHCSRLSLRHILKQQSIPKLLWNAQDLAASLSKQFKIEVSLPADDRLLLTTVSEPVASALPVATAGADEVAGVTATDSVAATTKAAATAARTDPIEAAESGKSSSPDRSVPVKARGTCGRGGRCSHIPFSVPKGTTRTPNCLCDLQLLEFKAHSIDSLSDAAGGSASFRALDECVDQYLAAKGPHAGVVLPAADEMRHDFRAQHLDLMRRLKADPDALRARPIRPKDIKYFVNCVQFLPLMHRIFEPLITLAGTDQAQQMLKAVNEATSYLVRRRTAACVSGAESDERLPDPTMEEIWSERAAKLEAPSTTTKQSAKI